MDESVFLYPSVFVHLPDMYTHTHTHTHTHTQVRVGKDYSVREIQ